MSLNIKGVIVPPVTPFDAAGEIDVPAIQRLVDFLIDRGVNALFPGGTTGEGPLLTTDERRRLAEAFVAAADNRIPVIVHTGAITTQIAHELTRHARAIGAQAAALIPPYYYKCDDAALRHHFTTIANAVPDFPIYLYNNPARTGNALSSELMDDLLEQCPNIVGMKDSSGDLKTLFAMSVSKDGAFNTASGNDEQILAGLAMGFDACVSGNANVVPELVVALYRSVVQGDLATARGLQYKLDAVREILEDGADLSLFKGILARRGLPVGHVRAPLMQAPESVIAERWQALCTLNLNLESA
mgnify:CR=1 FL=1